MSSCCDDHEHDCDSHSSHSTQDEKEPNSIIGRWLYRIGKDDAEKNGNESNSGGSCCS